MKATRKKFIQNKVFTKEDIRIFWTKIKNAYDASQKEKKHSSLKLEINCLDGVSFESETNDLLQDGDIIDTKRCSKVSIEYHDYEQERRISLTLSHGDSYDNCLIVRGDKQWVSGTFDSLNDVIESAKPQEHWFIRCKDLFLHIGGLFVGFMVYRLFDTIWYQNIQPIDNPSENIRAIRDFFHKNPLVIYMIQLVVYWLQGISLLWWLRDWVLKLWPSIEFDFGPEHKKIEKMRRKRLGLFLSIIVTPLLLSFIYDIVIKKVLLK